MNFDAILTHPALAGMRNVRQWLVYALTPSAKKPGKLDKVPLHFATGLPTSVTAAGSWTGCATAVETAHRWGAGFGAGFAFTADCGYWFVDLDSCLQPDGQWSPLAQQLVTHVLAGAAVEVSASGKGLHLFGRGTVPPHSSKNIEHHAECYTDARFCAMTGDGLQGNCDVDLTAGISWVAQTYFPPRAEAANTAPTPDEGPCPEWRGPTDDDDLLRRALASRSASATFSGGASFADLWEANAAALARAYPADASSSEPFDRSSADAALASHLSFWTGRDLARIERLMRRSALKRDKWDDRSDYLVDRTIRNACRLGREVFGQRPQVEAKQAPVQAAGGPLVAPVTAAGGAGAAGQSHHILADSPLDTARAFMSEVFPGGTLRRWQGTFYRWRGGAWSEASEEDIRADVYTFIDSRRLSFFKPTQSKVSNVLDALKSAAHLDSTTVPPCWLEGEPIAPAADLVACANGLLHLRTRTLHAATPSLFSFSAIPLAYRSDSPAPAAWLTFLAQILPNDSEAIATLQELFGYLLTADTSQQKIFLIVGPKRSGKGTLGRVLNALLGAANVASPTLASMAERFGLEPLVGKLVAILSDARISGRTDQQAVAENLLRISGEDQVGVDRKHRAPLTLRLGVRVVLLTNEVPRIADASGAMASRFVIIKMGESFYGREDPGLTARLLAELPGIFCWAVEGWHTLNARRFFVPPRSSEATAQDLADLGSPITAFVRDACTVGPGVEVGVDQLFAAWRQWCGHEGIDRPGNKSHFGRDLNAAMQGVRIRQPRGEGDRIRVYAGIGLRAGTRWHGQLPIAG